MADLTAARDDERQNGELIAVPLAAVKVFKGALLTFNSAGYADVGDASEPLAGVAIETVDNSAGAAGDKTVRVWRTGVFTFAGSGFTQADVGKQVQVSDDQTVVLNSAGSGKVQIGRIVEFVSATSVRVQINVDGNTLLA